MTLLGEELIRYGRLISAKGLVIGPGGNLSAREENLMWVTPSGMAFDDLTPEDLVGIDLETGRVVRGSRRPTSEVLMHLFIVRRRPDVNAIVHTHPPSTIALVSAGHTVKAMFPDFVVYLGAEVPNLEYITPTTRELAERMVEALGDGPGLTMTNHGALTVGGNFREAMLRTEVLEEGAKIQLAAMSAGRPRYLSPAEAEEISGLGSEQYRQQLLREMQG
jgi:L-fuculose-phosphate aldolase